MLAWAYRSGTVELCVCVCVCMIPTWSIEEIFDLEAEQRGRDARLIVCLSCYRLQPKHIVVQRLWQSLSWIWTKDEEIKKDKKTEKGEKEHVERKRTGQTKKWFKHI